MKTLGHGAVVRVTGKATLFRLANGDHYWVPNEAVDPGSVSSPGASGVVGVRDDHEPVRNTKPPQASS